MKNYIRRGLTALVSIPFVAGVHLYDPYKANAQPYIPTSLPPIVISEYGITKKDGIVTLEEYLDKETRKVIDETKKRLRDKSREELPELYWHLMAQHVKEVFKDRFKEYDANEDGVISKKDDIDGDGYITPHDKSLFQKMKRMHTFSPIDLKSFISRYDQGFDIGLDQGKVPNVVTLEEYWDKEFKPELERFKIEVKTKTGQPAEKVI